MAYPVAELNAGIAESQFELAYQPLVKADTRAVAGAEALLRWRHPRRGFLTAGAFLPAIERHRLMGDLTDWVVDAAVAQAARWREDGLALPVSVNLSATLLHDEDLVWRVQGALRTHGLPADQLTLEVTETGLTRNPGTAHAIFTALRGMGVRISLDDFGTGYTSLAMLKTYAFDEVKIDQSFVSAMRQSPADAAVVRAVRELGHQLGLEVLAEGVEDEATARLLEEIRCDLLQGYHFARPLPAARLPEWVAGQRGGSGGVPAPARAEAGPAVLTPASRPAAARPAAAAAVAAAAREQERLAVEQSLGLLDPQPEQVLDDLVAVAAAICGTPIALLTVLDGARLWFKSRLGLEVQESQREHAFCTLAIENPNGVMEIPDALTDDRFAVNPLVTGDPHIRFYAGAPLVTDEGLGVGCICVIDSVPRLLSRSQREALHRLSRVAMSYLQTSRTEAALQRLSHVMSVLSRMRAVEEIPAAATAVAAAARHLLRADGAALMLAPAPGAVHYETSGVSARPGDVAAATQVVLDSRADPAIAEVLRTRQPFYVADAPNSPHVDQDLVCAFGVSSVLFVPVTADASAFGMLVIWWTVPHPAPPDTATAASLLATEAGTALSRLYALDALRHAADTDPLTGLLNRRSFGGALKHLPVDGTVLMIDLDHFKDINDVGGHQAGDQILKAFSAHLRAAARPQDLIARWGGEEFAVALAEDSPEAAQAMLGRLRASWTRTPTFSSGAATIRADEPALHALARADALLYEAKHNGRNQDRAEP
jgi:diguanylate cyclase (GGDEF)-like protein